MARRTVKSLQDALREVEREVEVRARDLEQRRQHAQSLRQMIAFYGAQEEATARDEAAAAGGDGAARMVRAAPQDTKVARNALYEILRETGRPMHYRVLLDALIARGVRVEGKDPGNNVRSHLSHDGRFVPVGGGVWDLASRAAAPRETPVAAPAVAPQPVSPRGAGFFAPEDEDEADDALPQPDPPADEWLTDDWIAAHEPQEELAEVPF